MTRRVPKLNPRAAWIFYLRRRLLYRRADNFVARIMLAEGLAAAALAWWESAWAYLALAVVLGLAPVAVARVWAGRPETRYSLAVAQMLMAFLLVRVPGGFADAQFLVFGSLAILAMYRDWRVFVPATLVLAAVFHSPALTAWAMLENAFLIPACQAGVREMEESARQRSELEGVHLSMDELRRARDAAEARGTAEARAVAAGGDMSESLSRLAEALLPEAAPAVIEPGTAAVPKE